MSHKTVANGISRNVLLKPYTTYKIGGTAEYFARAHDIQSLISLLSFDANARILGKGSNLLVSDSGVKGLVITLEMNEVAQSGSILEAECGAGLARLSKYAFDNSLSGLEWACGIPASVGGAVKMNAGAFGACIADILIYADVLRGGEIVRLKPHELDLSYRHSNIQQGDIVLRAAFKLTPSDKAGIAKVVKANNQRRNLTQPSGYSAGSVFKAADKPAGWYIDNAGLKGLISGGAVISEKHANFIINYKNASSFDVASLINAIKAEVFVRFNVMLEEEIEYWGEF